MHGLQCPKLLWYEYNDRSSLPPPEPALEFAFSEGHRVGAQARCLFPDGLMIERSWDPREQHARSLKALEQRRPLFEAGFVHGRAYALADILVPVEQDQWDLIEVKASTGLKEEHYHDIAFQRYVYQGAGLKLRRAYLMHVNRDYVRHGRIDPKGLLVQHDASRESEVLEHGVSRKIEAMVKAMAAEKAPEVKIGPHCTSPRDCPMIDLCWNFLPDKDSIFILYSGGRKSHELLEQGVESITDIPDEFELNYRQEIQVRAHKENRPYVERDSLRRFLEQIKYPAYFIDFETVAPAVPLFEGSSPYEYIPFQFSLYIVDSESALPRHHAFLAEGRSDPRPVVLQQLKALLGDQGSIIAYSAGFEKRCLKEAARAFPQYLDWQKRLDDRFVDLLEPFQKFYFYHPAQNGRASLKNVLPALTGDSYQGLAIAEGGAASAEFFRVTYGDKAVPDNEEQKVRQALLDYCDLDTRGMVAILAALRQAVT
ncbi:MAG: DUF2779 domain-containing protein [Candidatus Saganbacteria bacterium]|nr:DUF2779 domain-containing protein [Candidatus Saganbacteria bacterium]